MDGPSYERGYRAGYKAGVKSLADTEQYKKGYNDALAFINGITAAKLLQREREARKKMKYEEMILEARNLLTGVQYRELERSGKLIDKKKYRWIMTQEVFDGVVEVFSKITNMNTLQCGELWGIAIEIRENTPFNTIGLIEVE